MWTLVWPRTTIRSPLEELAIGDKEQAATVAPEGTQAAHDQSNGETVDKKHIWEAQELCGGTIKTVNIDVEQ